ncbi:MAG: hypothetical protein HOO04_02375, partial [Phycisphaerae bacterium]|nr:hypothetical protein [Phycisphaerae bacterium]
MSSMNRIRASFGASPEEAIRVYGGATLPVRRGLLLFGRRPRLAAMPNFL